MAITPTVPSTSAFALPPAMSEILWALNPTTGYYDIFNQFTSVGNQGNLRVIQSKILITLSTIQGEWAAQPDFGLPVASFNSNSDNPDVLAQVIVGEILTVQNVNNVVILSFDYTPTTRLFTASFSVDTIYGTTTVTVG